MDTAAKELECFQALQKQEQFAASHRISNIWEEVQKQKELERTLQKRYGDLLEELERTRHQMDEYRMQAQRQEEIAANNRELEFAESAAKQSAEQSKENTELIAGSDEVGSSMPIDPSHDVTAGPQMDSVQEHAQSATAHDNIPPAADGKHLTPVEDNGYVGPDRQSSGLNGAGDGASSEAIAGEDKMAQDVGDGVANDSMTNNEIATEDHDVKVLSNMTKQEASKQEKAVDDGFVDTDAKEVSNSGGEM